MAQPKRAVALLVLTSAAASACAGPPPGSTAGDVTSTTSTDATGALVAELRGARLIVDVPSTVAADERVTFKLRLENGRKEPLQYDFNSCFAYVLISAPLPNDRYGRKDWPGPEAAFKSFALANGMQAGAAPATAPMTIEPISDDCEGSNGLTEPLAPGGGLRATFDWNARFDEDVPLPSGRVDFTISAPIYRGHGDVTPPPPPTSFPTGHWFPDMDSIVVNGSIAITGEPRPMISMGEAVDGALSDSEFRAFVDSRVLADCDVNFFLANLGGSVLPKGPGWVLELFCQGGEAHMAIKVDPWTGKVLGSYR